MPQQRQLLHTLQGATCTLHRAESPDQALQLVRFISTRYQLSQLAWK